MFGLGISGTLLLGFVLAVVHRLCLIFYNIYLHPLRKYPGPKLFAASWLPHFYYHTKGDMTFVVRDLHNKYGPVVRIGPSELSYISGQAWKDIYGQQAGMPQNRKDPFSYNDPSVDELMANNMILASDKAHARQRSQLAHAFSARALHEQQPLISSHIDMLVDKLRSSLVHGSQDMTAWYLWTTFDIIGDLAFGESFHCLENIAYHPWIENVLTAINSAMFVAHIRRFGLNIAKMLPKALLKSRYDMIAFCKERVNARLAIGHDTDRRDFTSFMLSATKKGEPGMTLPELHANAEVVTIAGSETTASLLAALNFLLLKERPDYYIKLKDQVRSVFPEDDLQSMNFQTVTAKLPLLVAAIAEALRVYPPAPSGLARLVEHNGRNIDGQFVPPGTACVIYQWAANHSAANWYEPDKFIPERWLPVEESQENSKFAQAIASDCKDSMNVFSLGARGCLGRNLAEVEMRLIFARILYNFDMELVRGQDDWMSKQKAFGIWGKGPLMVKVTDATTLEVN